jgi:hypothetical protein
MSKKSKIEGTKIFGLAVKIWNQFFVNYKCFVALCKEFEKLTKYLCDKFESSKNTFIYNSKDTEFLTELEYWFAFYIALRDEYSLVYYGALKLRSYHRQSYGDNMLDHEERKVHEPSIKVSHLTSKDFYTVYCSEIGMKLFAVSALFLLLCSTSYPFLCSGPT